MIPKPGIYFDATSALRSPLGRRALFLDRDGVINIDHGYVCSSERTDWVDGIFEVCAKAQSLGYRLIVVTNQAGIARGYYSELDLLAYTRWVHSSFLKRGVRLEATIYCPHHPTSGEGHLRTVCNCRKPAPGMLRTAQVLLGIDLSESALIGDRPTDIEAGYAAGIGRLYQLGSSQAGLAPGTIVRQTLIQVSGELDS